MADKTTLNVVIGASLAKGFNSIIDSGTSKFKEIGSAIKNMEKNSALTGSAIDKLKLRYDSFLGSLNKQQQIIQKRGFYRSQILDMVALGAALVAPIKSAMDFENSLAGIKSVVNFSEPEGLKKLGDSLTEISTRVPIAVNDLAKIAAVGGRYGVKLKDLAGFTENVSKTTIAWGMNAEEGAKKISSMMKSLGIGVQDLEFHFDIINELGNKTGATASDILTSVNRSVKGIASFKLSIPQVTALTSTLMSFDMTAEEAGSSVNTMLQKLSIAPQLGAGAQKSFEQMGLSTKEFSKIAAKDPQMAINSLFNALAKLNDAERNTATYNIFGRGAAGTVNALVKGLKVYRKNIETVSKISNFKGSRDIDYGIVLDTTRSKITMLQSSLSSLWREIGDSMLPIVGTICDSLREIIEPIRTWMKENRKLIGTVTSVLGILAGLRIGMFILGYASTFLFGGLNRLVIVGKALGIGLNVIGIGAKSLLFSFLKFAGITGTIAGGLLGISKGIDGRLVFSFETLMSRINWLAGIGKAKIKTFWEGLTNVKIPAFTEKLRVLFYDLKNMGISGIIDRIKTFDFKFKLPNIFAWFDEIYGKIQNFNIDLKFKLPDFSKITQHLKEKLSQVDFSILSEKIKSMFSEIFDSKNFSLPKNIFSDLNLSALELAGGIAVLAASSFVLPNVIGVAGSALVALVSLIPIAINGFTGLFQASWFLIGTVLPGLGGMLCDISEKLWYLGGKALPYVTKAFGILANVTKTHPIIAALTAALTIGYWIYENWGHIGERISNFFTDLYNGVASFFEKIWNWCKGIGNFIGGFLDTVGTLGKVFGGVLKNVSSGIKKFVFGEDVKIPIVEEIKESPFWKKLSSDNKKENATKKLELPKIEPMHSEINRTQNNNFNITINATKNDDSESITNKVMNRVSDFSKTFLYDIVPEVM
ncbi:MAG: phage tail tape measure protein [Alphaproteobacteria bacterium]|nr:phage tail tape measure protein [Alphaproteobacteria bacterium]